MQKKYNFVSGLCEKIEFYAFSFRKIILTICLRKTKRLHVKCRIITFIDSKSRNLFSSHRMETGNVRVHRQNGRRYRTRWSGFGRVGADGDRRAGGGGL